MTILKSTDGGSSWPDRSFPGTGERDTYCEVIAVAPSNPAIVYAGGQVSNRPRITRSANGGSTWEDITSNLSAILQIYDAVYAIWVSPYDPDAVVLGTSNGIFTCTVDDQSWNRTWNKTAINHWTNDFTYDQATGTIYAATTLGVYSSQDEGAAWQQVNDGLGYLESLYINIDHHHRLLYVGTAGASVWRLSLPNASGYEYFDIVDDFESYTDYDQGGEAIWQTWIDGLDVPENGSQIGYLQPPYAEQTIVHGGAQSMPYFYDNTSGYSEASMTLNSQRDWTMYGVKTLSLWFHGDLTNAPEPMYVSIANTQQTPGVIYHDDPGAPQTNNWRHWVIDLNAFSDLGVDLTDIDKLSIGFGDKYNRQVGGTGLMFLDDIRLYRPPEQTN